VTSGNSEILIICHLRRVVPIPQVLYFYQKKGSSMKLANLRNMFKKASKCISTSTTMISPEPRLLLHQLLQLQRLQKTEKRTLMMLNQHIKEISHWNTPLINFTAPYRDSRKKFTNTG
jgi:uncharacterized protein with von Willebrand factor type A (vWA) domain